MSIEYLSTFSGIEAASVAWHPLDFKPVGFSEIEKFPSAVLAHRFPTVPNYGDITNFREWPNAAFNLLVGGSPCQSFSIAGLRKGLDDPRGNLMLTYLAVAAKHRPEWLLWENVPGVLSSSGGRDFASFIGGLAELGYGWAYRVLDAQYVRVDGFGRAVPQRRRRVFVVGCLGGWARAAAVLFDAASLRGDPAPRRETGERPAPTLSARTQGGGGLGTDFDLDGGQTAVYHDVSHCLNAGGMGRVDYETETFVDNEGLRHSHCAEVAPTLNAHFGDKQGLEDQHINAGGGMFVDNEHPSLIAFDTTQITSGANYSKPRPGDPCHPLAAGAHPPAIAFSCKDSGADASRGDAPTLRSMGHSESHANAGGQLAVAFDLRGREGGAMPEGPHDTANIRAASGGSSRSYLAYAIQERAVSENLDAGPQGSGVQEGVAYTLEARNKVQSVASQWAVRRLTPRECERLQGFPDGWTDVPFRGKPAADGPRYKALGNSMAVNVMRWIGHRIKQVHEGQL